MRKFLGVILTLFSAVPVVAAEKDIVDTAVAAKFKTLVAAVKAADLVETLKGEGPFTVFAPTDEAFEKLPKGTLDELLKPENKDKLKAILTYHVVSGKVMAADVVKLDGKKVKTVEGRKLEIKLDGDTVMVGPAKVTKTDIETSNGVIHVIDTVLLPPAAKAEEKPVTSDCRTSRTAAHRVLLCLGRHGPGPEAFSPLIKGHGPLPDSVLWPLSMKRKHKSIVIIGAGPGGLAAAMLLARSGLRVTVLERQAQVGGRTTTLAAKGFRFDLGPTFFLYPQVLEAIFAAVGKSLWNELELIRLDPQYSLIFGAGGQLHATPDINRMEQAISALCPADAASFRRFMDDNRFKLQQFAPVLERAFLGWRELFSAQMLKLLPLLRPWLSLDQELARYFADPRVRLAFSFQSKYLGMSPYRCPSLFSILSFLEYEHGVYHPIGGCGAVTDCMARIAREMGVKIRLEEEATEILFDGRRAVGVRTAEGIYRADAVVVNADFARAMTRLVPDRLRRRWNDRRISQKQFSCSTFMLYLGIEGRHDHLGHHTIYLDENYVRNLREIEDLHVLSESPSFYVQNACVTDPSLAPKGMSTLYVLVPVTHQHPNVEWSRHRDAFRSLALASLAKIGIKDVERRICFEHIITPADWDQRYEIHRGATFNLAHSLTQMLHLRPRNRFEDLEAVYLVGGGTHPGSGLPVIFESARITSRLLVEDLGLSSRCWGTEPAELASAHRAESVR